MLYNEMHRDNTIFINNVHRSHFERSSSLASFRLIADPSSSYFIKQKSVQDQYVIITKL